MTENNSVDDSRILAAADAWIAEGEQAFMTPFLLYGEKCEIYSLMEAVSITIFVILGPVHSMDYELAPIRTGLRL